MSDSEELAFASEFPAATREQWLKLVDGVLKGAPFEKRLVSRTYDGLTIQPLYPRAGDARPVAGRAPGTSWTVMQRIDQPDPAAANEQALIDLENGATGVTGFNLYSMFVAVVGSIIVLLIYHAVAGRRS